MRSSHLTYLQSCIPPPYPSFLACFLVWKKDRFLFANNQDKKNIYYPAVHWSLQSNMKASSKHISGEGPCSNGSFYKGQRPSATPWPWDPGTLGPSPRCPHSEWEGHRRRKREWASLDCHAKQGSRWNQQCSSTLLKGNELPESLRLFFWKAKKQTQREVLCTDSLLQVPAAPRLQRDEVGRHTYVTKTQQLESSPLFHRVTSQEWVLNPGTPA